MPSPQIMHQFKITLLDTHPEIWRRIQVAESYTFWDLHVAIQSAMGWQDCHLHMFRIGKRSEIIINGNQIEDPFGGDENTFNGWETGIARFLKAPGDVAMYEYDMGDGWLHEILLEGIFLKEKGVKYPRCIAGARACPPEDCGGTPGFEHLLDVLASPQHPEYAECIGWLGKKYDPEKFDAGAVKFANPKIQWKRWQKY
jgi:Plasmid pRiA4b ORF-3-like protein.